LGSLRFHLGSGTRTGLSERIRDFGLKGEVEISPEDGSKMNLKQGEKVTISSQHGSISREVVFKKYLSPGFIFVPTAFQDNSARKLIGLTRLGMTDAPGCKVVQVKLEKLNA
jgi:predicted molibdopterin-dependent oxidoreductase YjgC